MRSAAYMRLKNLQLGYDLPLSLLKRIGVNNMTVFVNAQNLLTITDFWKGYDPEINYDASVTDGVELGSGGFYPQVKVVSFGIDLKF